MRFLRHPVALAIGGALLLALLACVYFVSQPRSIASLLDESEQRLIERQYAAAEKLAVEILRRRPADCSAALIAARAAAAQQQDSRALQHLRPSADQPGGPCPASVRLAADLAYRNGYARDAERYLQHLLQHDPSSEQAANQLAFLLGVEGRAYEATVPLLHAIKSGSFTPHHLIMLAAGEPVVHDVDFVQRCRTAVPDDPLPLLGQAREALVQQEFATARPLLEQIVASAPDCLEAQARLGLLLQQQGQDAEFLDWHSDLPADIWHPEIWVVRALWARRQAEPAVAMRCFWEALRLDPNHRVACYQLGQLLQESGKGNESAACFKRAEQLEQLAYLVDRIYENPQAPELMVEASESTEALGRLWEAWGWAHGTTLADPANQSAKGIARRLLARLQPDLPRTIPRAQLGTTLRLGELPLPDWQRHSRRAPDDVRPVAALDPAADVVVRFADLAEETGLSFTYDNGHRPGAEHRMLESMGGGVAAIDFDSDGWTDLYLTQAGGWEADASQPRPPDCLFRNLAGQSFIDVTAAAGLGDRSFSQGCTVGDFNGDGFPDLYVANIGRNRLYQNQGDGTFVDVTASAGIQSEMWTNSCLLADINGDGLPDLYDVNYLSIKQAPRTLCVRGEEARTCGPGSFLAEPDQLYLNLGDGTFEDITAVSGIDIPNGKGLGIVAADFAGTGRLNLFVANDSVPNFYFVNGTESPGASPQFTEEALVSGLALSHDGLSAAWMGVASGDANGDGRLDLFATTYADQSKSLFLQEKTGGLFVDAIVSSGLNPPTWKPLGFGTQFVDGELDGWPDLVITNGHVFDLSHLNQAYEMRPQYLRNIGQGKFIETPDTEVGVFFTRKYLGRGLARIDWNRDGLDDFAVSNMNAPVSLVTNQTKEHGHYLTLRLVGTKVNRDAIGTQVTVKSGDRSWMQHLAAGDGYQASNERCLRFGLGQSTRIDDVTITWLGGNSTTLSQLDVDEEWLVVEGRDAAIRLRK